MFGTVAVVLGSCSPAVVDKHSVGHFVAAGCNRVLVEPVGSVADSVAPVGQAKVLACMRSVECCRH